MISSPTPGRFWCRTLTKVDVPPRTTSRMVVALVMLGPEALATAIPVPATSTAAEAAAMVAPLPKRRFRCSMMIPFWYGHIRDLLAVTPRLGQTPARRRFRLYSRGRAHGGPAFAGRAIRTRPSGGRRNLRTLSVTEIGRASCRERVE